MSRLEGRVALVTGAARGQGRAIALKLAREGADIIALDICRQIESIPYPLGTEEELAETAAGVEALDRRVVAAPGDVRSLASVQQVVDRGVAEIGPIDIVSANAGVYGAVPTHQMSPETWQDMLDVNLTGVWNTVRAVLPGMLERGQGGSIVLTSSTAGIRGFPAMSHYTAAKHGVVGLMKTLAAEVGRANIRVNTVHPTSVNTPMIHNETMYRMLRPDLDAPEADDVALAFTPQHELPFPWVEAEDVANMVLFLASDEARYVTGSQMRVDLGFCEA